MGVSAVRCVRKEKERTHSASSKMCDRRFYYHGLYLPIKVFHVVVDRVLPHQLRPPRRMVACVVLKMYLRKKERKEERKEERKRSRKICQQHAQCTSQYDHGPHYAPYTPPFTIQHTAHTAYRIHHKAHCIHQGRLQNRGYLRSSSLLCVRIACAQTVGSGGSVSVSIRRTSHGIPYNARGRRRGRCRSSPHAPGATCWVSGEGEGE